MTTTTPEEEALLTVPEAASLLRVSRALAYRMVATGEIPSVRIGQRVVRIRRDQLDRWLDDRSR
jgi:excisionase family DNA binding protein